MSGHLDNFSTDERAALDLLGHTFRALWTTPIAEIRMDHADVVARGLYPALGAAVASEPMRRELARRTYLVLMHDGGAPPASEEDIVRRAYHDRDAMWRWSGEVLKWFGDLTGHLRDLENEAAQSTTRH